MTGSVADSDFRPLAPDYIIRAAERAAESAIRWGTSKSDAWERVASDYVQEARRIAALPTFGDDELVTRQGQHVLHCREVATYCRAMGATS